MKTYDARSCARRGPAPREQVPDPLRGRQLPALREAPREPGDEPRARVVSHQRPAGGRVWMGWPFDAQFCKGVSDLWSETSRNGIAEHRWRGKDRGLAKPPRKAATAPSRRVCDISFRWYGDPQTLDWSMAHPPLQNRSAVIRFVTRPFPVDHGRCAGHAAGRAQVHRGLRGHGGADPRQRRRLARRERVRAPASEPARAASLGYVKFHT